MAATEKLAPVMPPEVARHSPPYSMLRARRVSNPEGLDVAIAGVPFDFATYQQPGSRYGPAKVREFSRVLRVGHYLGTFPFDLANVGDVGDTPVQLFDFDGTIAGIESFFRRIVDADARPLAMGGDHTITLPIIRAVASKWGRLGVLHFDAHPDTIDNIDGQKVNPGTMFRRAVEEGLTDPRRHVEIGIRGTIYDMEPFDWARDQGITILTIDDVEELGARQIGEMAREKLGEGPVYVTFDIDALDIAVAPGTTNAEPGGMTMREAHVILRAVKGLNVVGGDVTELCPPAEPADSTAIVAVNLLFEILCLLAESHAASGNEPQAATS